MDYEYDGYTHKFWITSVGTSLSDVVSWCEENVSENLWNVEITATAIIRVRIWDEEWTDADVMMFKLRFA